MNMKSEPNAKKKRLTVQCDLLEREEYKRKEYHTKNQTLLGNTKLDPEPL